MKSMVLAAAGLMFLGRDCAKRPGAGRGGGRDSPSRNVCPAMRSAKAPRTRSAPSSTASTAATPAPRRVIHYSDANKNSGITWNEDVFKEYIKDPRAKIPGTKMIFPGIKNEKEAGDLWAYLKHSRPTDEERSRAARHRRSIWPRSMPRHETDSINDRTSKPVRSYPS